MKLTKLFQKDADEKIERGAKVQQFTSSAKSVDKPLKPKKPEAPRRKVSRKPEESRMEWWNEFRQYLREVVFELRKVVWPSRKETIGSTSVVLVLVLLASIFLGFVDAILSRFVRLLVG